MTKISKIFHPQKDTIRTLYIIQSIYRRSKMSLIYVIMKTMVPPGYRHNGFVANHVLGHMM